MQNSANEQKVLETFDTIFYKLYRTNILKHVNYYYFRSRSSGYSSRTRREERRKQDLREGGFYENIALMRALHNLIQESYGLCLDVKNLCSLYMTFEHDFPKAKQLQDSLANLLHNIECSTSTIWPANLNSVNIPITRELTNLRKNLDELGGYSSQTCI